MARTDTAAELAAKLIEALRGIRQRGEAYPLTVADLAARIEPAKPSEEIERALLKKPFAHELLRARKKDPASPIALAADAAELAGGDLLLEYALRRVCTLEKPLHPLARVAQQVDAALRPAFAAALDQRIAEGRLPSSVGARDIKGKAHLYLQEFPPPPQKKAPAEELSEGLLLALMDRQARAEGYPPTLAELAAAVAPEAKPSAIKQATGREPFHSGAIWAVPGKLDAPVALAEDRAALADSRQLLEYLLQTTTSPRRPLAAPDLLQDRLGGELRPLFTEALARRLRDHKLPPGVGVLTGSAGPELFLEAALPPSTLLAWRLLRALELRRQSGGIAYPVLLTDLGRETDPAASAEMVQDAVGEKILRPHVLAALPTPDSPVALAEDAALLAAYPPLIEKALASARTAANQALPITDLKKKVARALQPAFVQALEQRITEGTLSPEVGLLRVKGKALLFLLADIAENRTASPTPPPSPQPADAQPPPPTSFAERFDSAFDRLDRERGGHNLVSLVDLRELLGDDRTTFNTELLALRRAGRYSLSGAEGRHGISAEERDASIREGGTFLLYVSRRSE
jgi:hypothetical protein